MAGLYQPADQYELLASVRLVGMMLIVAVKKSIKDHIKCAVDSVGTGALNMLVNILFDLFSPYPSSSYRKSMNFLITEIIV